MYLIWFVKRTRVERILVKLVDSPTLRSRTDTPASDDFLFSLLFSRSPFFFHLLFTLIVLSFPYTSLIDYSSPFLELCNCSGIPLKLTNFECSLLLESRLLVSHVHHFTKNYSMILYTPSAGKRGSPFRLFYSLWKPNRSARDRPRSLCTFSGRNT